MSLTDLSGVIASLSSGTYAVTRPAVAAYDDGVLQEPDDDPTLFDIVASVQPATGRDLRRLPEGQDIFEVKVLFTQTELRTATFGGAGPDSVEINGESYQVQTVDRWAELGNYWRVLATLE